MTITVQNRQRTVPLDLKALRDFAHRALSEVLRLPPESNDILGSLEEVGVTIVSDARIARMHLDFMNLPGPTDVLTFAEGDIVISAQTASSFALEYGQTPQQETSLYILHGLLHLRGFDDIDSADAEKMRRIQTQLFARLGKHKASKPF